MSEHRLADSEYGLCTCGLSWYESNEHVDRMERDLAAARERIADLTLDRDTLEDKLRSSWTERDAARAESAALRKTVEALTDALMSFAQCGYIDGCKRIGPWRWEDPMMEEYSCDEHKAARPSELRHGFGSGQEWPKEVDFLRRAAEVLATPAPPPDARPRGEWGERCYCTHPKDDHAHGCAECRNEHGCDCVLYQPKPYEQPTTARENAAGKRDFPCPKGVEAYFCDWPECGCARQERRS